MSAHPMTADGRVDMDPQSAMIRYCTWAGCPGIEMSAPIVEREHGHSHDICETANQAPFVLADERKRQAHFRDLLVSGLSEAEAQATAWPETPARGYHLSDCALHNEPAMPARPCDCADREVRS